jgi:hypothetical protein
LIGIAACSMTQEAPKVGVIRGYVTDNDGRPLADVRVTLRSGGGLGGSRQTNASGQFSFVNMSLGNYTLTVEKRGYRLHTSNLNISNARIRSFTTDNGEMFPVEISSTHLNADVVFSFRPGATIVGSVLDSDEKPIAASVVLLRRRFNTLGVPQLVSVPPRAIVDATGEYTFDGVDEGEYFLKVEGIGERYGTQPLPPAYAPFTKSVRSDGPIVIESTASFPPVYYPRTTDIRNAAPIVVGSAALLTGINIVVDQNRFTITGRITNADENVSFPVPQIHLVPAVNSPDSTAVRNVATDQSKAFEIQNVGSGAYDLVTFVFRDGVSYMGRTQVEVHSSDVDGVELVLRRAADLTGKVVSANPEAGPNLSELRIVLTAVKPTTASPLNTFSASVSSDGSFELKRLPAAEYVLSVQSLAPDHYVESARLDNEDILHHSFRITSHTSRLEIMVNAPGGEIAGQLSNERGDRLNVAATIVVVPVQRSDNPLNSFKVTRSNDRGEFDLSGIRPGQYHVLAFEPVAASPAYYNEDFLRRYEYRGSPVTVTAGQVIKLDLIPVKVQLP